MFFILLISCLNINECTILQSEQAYPLEVCEILGLQDKLQVQQNLPLATTTHLCVHAGEPA